MEEVKSFNMRLSKPMWRFLKKTAAAQDTNMTAIINELLEKYKKKHEKVLTYHDANV